MNTLNEQLMNTVRDIGKCKNLIVPSDKTANFYEISISDYNNLLDDNITKNYEKYNDQILNDINLKSKKKFN